MYNLEYKDSYNLKQTAGSVWVIIMSDLSWISHYLYQWFSLSGHFELSGYDNDMNVRVLGDPRFQCVSRILMGTDRYNLLPILFNSSA